VTGSGHDRITGSAVANRLSGGEGEDLIRGGAGADTLRAGGGADTLVGETGADRLVGGAGADRFVFGRVADTPPAARDRIVDFERGVDLIDLSAIDASNRPGEQAFSFRGARWFGGEAGELRYAAGLLIGDLDGDRDADLMIRLSCVAWLTADDLVL
jgi:serralysin